MQQFKKGLTALLGIKESNARARRELELQTGLGIALTANKGYASDETGQVYVRARQLCETIGDAQALLRVSYGQFLFYLMAGKIPQSYQLAKEISSLAEKLDSVDARILGHRTLGVSLFEFGRLAEARRELEIAAKLLGERNKGRQFPTGSETSIMIFVWLAGVQLLQGHLEDAFRSCELALREAAVSSAQNTRAFAMGFATTLSYWVEDYQDVVERAQALEALTTEHDLEMHRSLALMCLGLGQMHHDMADASPNIRKGLDAYRRSGTQWALPFWLASFAATLPDAADERITVVDDAFEVVKFTQERWHEPELHRLRGDHALSKEFKDCALAERCYLEAKRIAQDQGSMLHDLRISTSLASLWRDQGRIAEARDMLSPVVKWFTQGLDLPVLERPKRLLAELT
jgi:hypothetical protein